MVTKNKKITTIKEPISFEIKREENGDIVLNVTIKNEDIKKAWEEEIEAVVKNTTIAGFRTGTAPRNLVEKNIDKEKLKEDVLKKLLPKAYLEAIEKNKLKPIVTPRIHIEKVEDPTSGKDWTFQATTCEAPDIDLGNYKEEIKKVNLKSKIIIPGKENLEPSLDELLTTLIKTIKTNIPQIILDTETERLLSQLLSEIKRLGLTLDQYLASSKKTIEDLKKEYEIKAKADLNIEFALAKIADTEKVEVDPKELDEALAKTQSEEERKQLANNMYLLASIIRQQKTLDFLKKL